jgi:hypothetical protein
VIELTPYPLLHVTKGNDRLKAGYTLMMPAGGKAGVMDRATPLDGQLAQVAYDRVVQIISVEAKVTKHGSLLVFAIDADTIELTSMIKRIFTPTLVGVTPLILLYLSRFWIFEWLSQEGQFGIRILRP